VLHNGRNPGRITQKGRPNFSCFFCKSAEKGAFAILEILFIKKMTMEPPFVIFLIFLCELIKNSPKFVSIRKEVSIHRSVRSLFYVVDVLPVKIRDWICKKSAKTDQAKNNIGSSLAAKRAYRTLHVFYFGSG
jgi:hypothetical protein